MRSVGGEAASAERIDSHAAAVHTYIYIVALRCHSRHDVIRQRASLFGKRSEDVAVGTVEGKALAVRTYPQIAVTVGQQRIDGIAANPRVVLRDKTVHSVTAQYHAMSVRSKRHTAFIVARRLKACRHRLCRLAQPSAHHVESLPRLVHSPAHIQPAGVAAVAGIVRIGRAWLQTHARQHTAAVSRKHRHTSSHHGKQTVAVRGNGLNRRTGGYAMEAGFTYGRTIDMSVIVHNEHAALGLSQRNKGMTSLSQSYNLTAMKADVGITVEVYTEVSSNVQSRVGGQQAVHVIVGYCGGVGIAVAKQREEQSVKLGKSICGTCPYESTIVLSNTVDGVVGQSLLDIKIACTHLGYSRMYEQDNT